MVPNHHYASHIPAQLEEFATVYEIWAFLAERLNKTLKATNLNGRRGGLQEVTMMREYQRDIALRSVVSNLPFAPCHGLLTLLAAVGRARRFDAGGWHHRWTSYARDCPAVRAQHS